MLDTNRKKKDYFTRWGDLDVHMKILSVSMEVQSDISAFCLGTNELNVVINSGRENPNVLTSICVSNGEL